MADRFDFSVPINADAILLVGPAESRMAWLMEHLPTRTTVCMVLAVTSMAECAGVLTNIPDLAVKNGTVGELDGDSCDDPYILYDVLVFHETDLNRETIERIAEYHLRDGPNVIISVENLEQVPDTVLARDQSWALVAVDWQSNPGEYLGPSVMGKLDPTLHSGIGIIFAEPPSPSSGASLCALIDLGTTSIVRHGHFGGSNPNSSTSPKEYGDLIDCPICHGILFHPRTLPCGHSLCTHCLLKIPYSNRILRGGQKRYKPEVPCPMCRLPSRVQLVERMQENLTMTALIGLVPGAKGQLDERENDYRIAAAIMNDMLNELVPHGTLVPLAELVNGAKLIMHDSRDQVTWTQYSDVIHERRTGKWNVAVRGQDAARFDDFFFHQRHSDHRMLVRIIERFLRQNKELSVLESTKCTGDRGRTLVHRRPSEWAHIIALTEEFGKWINENLPNDGLVMLGGQALDWIGQVFPEFERVWQRLSSVLDDPNMIGIVDRQGTTPVNLGLEALIERTNRRIANVPTGGHRRLSVDEHDADDNEDGTRVATTEIFPNAAQAAAVHALDMDLARDMEAPRLMNFADVLRRRINAPIPAVPAVRPRAKVARPVRAVAPNAY